MSEAHPILLFVDEELSLLQNLQRLLQDEPWDCHFVNSRGDALDFLAKHSVELVLTGPLRPENNGLSLLAQLKELYPGTVRLLLTSHTAEKEVVAALSQSICQQIIPKPWVDQELKEVIRSALRQSQQLKKHSPELQQLINSIPLLPALPGCYLEVRNCLQDDEIDLEKIANIISQDVGISTALLHWANSALFGQRYQVDSIQKAIIVLGTNIVESLVLSESINRTIGSGLPPTPGFQLKKFQKHSFATAIVARLLVKSLFSSDIEKQDRAFIAGLLHDLGKLAAAKYFSKAFAEAIDLSHERQCGLAEVELETLGVSHSQLGGFLAEWWALPPLIVSAIQWHHDPEASPIAPDLINAVHVANHLSYQFGFDCCGATPREERSECWDRFYLSEEGIEILQVETEKMINSLCS